MGEQVHLLRSLPRPERDITQRRDSRTPATIHIARWFGADYFDGRREYGYGGYHYDGRWVPVVQDIIDYYGAGDDITRWRILDVGCAKGFLVHDLCARGADAYGIDVSDYAVRNCHRDVVGRIHVGSADDLPYPDGSFDLVLCLNTLHNLTRSRCLRALSEIMRVSAGPAFVQVDSYTTPEEKQAFEEWVLTARYVDWPEGWLALFREAGYTGDYDWTIVG